MDKILDYLNRRNFKINTVEGARDALHDLLDSQPNRIIHSEGVADYVKELCEERGFTEEETSLAIQSAYLHEIGRSEKLKFAHFYPYDGYTYLKYNDWSETVTLTVLYHTYSEMLVNMDRADLAVEYMKNPFPSGAIAKIIEVVTYADVRVSPSGIRVSLEQRLDDVLDRYGADSAIGKHMLKVYQLEKAKE